MFITCASEGYVECWLVYKSQAECLIAHKYGPLACSKQIQNKYPLIQTIFPTRNSFIQNSCRNTFSCQLHPIRTTLICVQGQVALHRKRILTFIHGFTYRSFRNSFKDCLLGLQAKGVADMPQSALFVSWSQVLLQLCVKCESHKSLLFVIQNSPSQWSACKCTLHIEATLM